MIHATYRLTPFIEKVLSLVQATCDPRATDWAGSLGERLYWEFYQLPEPGDQIVADAAHVAAFKLQAVEEKLSGSPVSTRTYSEIPNRS